MRAQFINEIEFNLKKNPTDKFRGGFKKGPSFGPVENPRKRSKGLSPVENNIVDKHTNKLQDIEDEIQSYEYKIENLQQDLKDLTTKDFTEGEVEQFYAEVQERYGFNALDILNSGNTDEEKIKGIDALNPSDDFGVKEFEDLLHNYNYYHQDEPDPEEIERIEKEIKKWERQKEERINTLQKIQQKIYNIENY